ncbi:UNVERIFIED_CONTAM: hypothetical protein FKN15_011777 [Acipenser sinensis]
MGSPSIWRLTLVEFYIVVLIHGSSAAYGNGKTPTTSSPAQPSNPVHTFPAPKKEYLPVFQMNYPRIQIPFEITLWILLASLAKIGFNVYHKITVWVPECCLLITIGLIVGGIMYSVYEESPAVLTTDVFFLYLLPPIVLDAGYFMPTRLFFENCGTVLWFSVVGTLWNSIGIGISLFGICQIEAFGIQDINLQENLLFGTIISTVDPVAVLAVFEEENINEQLYIVVFGESLYNDAITVALYSLFKYISQMDPVDSIDIFLGTAGFFVVGFGGIMFGFLFGFVAAFTTRFTANTRELEPVFVFMYSYLAYLIAELFSLSSIMAIVTCALTMKYYVEENVSQRSCTTIRHFLKMWSSVSETLIFFFLGVTTVTSKHEWNWAYIGFTLIFCFVWRGLGVLVLAQIINNFRTIPFTFKDQFSMAYGGLRGAICFCLAFLLPDTFARRNLFTTAAIAVILFTVFIQAMEHTIAGIEDLCGQWSHYYWKDKFKKINDRFLRKVLIKDNKPQSSIVSLYKKLELQNALVLLDSNGGISGAPSLTSLQEQKPTKPETFLPEKVWSMQELLSKNMYKIRERALYSLFKYISQMDPVDSIDIFLGTAGFFVVGFGGIMFGFLFGFVAAFTTRFTANTRELEPVFVFMYSYLAYLIAELFSLSSIMAIVTCALTMKYYVEENVSQRSCTTIRHFLKMWSSVSETLIFFFLGVTTVTSKHEWNWAYIGFTLIFCFVWRGLGVLVLAQIINNFRTIPFTFKDQFSMAYGGLRGAICFCLAFLLPDTFARRNLFTTAAIAVILFTVFIQTLTYTRHSLPNEIRTKEILLRRHSTIRKSMRKAGTWQTPAAAKYYSLPPTVQNLQPRLRLRKSGLTGDNDDDDDISSEINFPPARPRLQLRAKEPRRALQPPRNKLETVNEVRTDSRRTPMVDYENRGGSAIGENSEGRGTGTKRALTPMRQFGLFNEQGLKNKEKEDQMEMEEFRFKKINDRFLRKVLIKDNKPQSSIVSLYKKLELQNALVLLDSNGGISGAPSLTSLQFKKINDRFLRKVLIKDNKPQSSIVSLYKKLELQNALVLLDSNGGISGAPSLTSLQEQKPTKPETFLPEKVWSMQELLSKNMYKIRERTLTYTRHSLPNEIRTKEILLRRHSTIRKSMRKAGTWQTPAAAKYYSLPPTVQNLQPRLRLRKSGLTGDNDDDDDISSEINFPPARPRLQLRAKEPRRALQPPRNKLETVNEVRTDSRRTPMVDYENRGGSAIGENSEGRGTGTKRALTPMRQFGLFNEQGLKNKEKEDQMEMEEFRYTPAANRREEAREEASDSETTHPLLNRPMHQYKP